MNRSENSNTPKDDPDKKLSDAYSDILENRKENSDVDDPLFKTLLNARAADRQNRQAIPVRGKESSWDSIISTIGDDQSSAGSNNQANITRIRSRRTWLKAAAAIILIAFSSLLLIQQFNESEPVPVAESGASIQTFELTDGSSVTLRPNSSLYKLTADEDERTYALSGEGIFDVISMPDRTFSVEAGSGRVVVTGTRFNLTDRNQTAKVYLFEGSVRFESEDGTQSVDLVPGEASEIDQSMQIVQPFNFEADLVTGWTQNRLTFRDRQAGSIFNELEFHFNIQITAPDDVKSESLGGTIQLDSAEQSLEDLGIVLGGSFDQTSDNVHEFRPDTN
jgi:ferric-dicitrate binding protein FerR (iron transport regulator)